MQRVVARSTAEAEYMAASDAAQEVVWLRRLLAELDTPQEGATAVYEDNQGCIAMAGKEDVSKRTKHINIRYFFITDRIKKKEVSVVWCPTADMIGDYATKPLQGALFRKFRDLIMGVVSTEDPGPGKVTPKSGGPDKITSKAKTGKATGLVPPGKGRHHRSVLGKVSQQVTRVKQTRTDG